MTYRQACPGQPELTAALQRDPGIDCKLEDMLIDPVIQLVMKSDGVSRADVEKLVYKTRARLMAAQASSPNRVAA